MPLLMAVREHYGILLLLAEERLAAVGLEDEEDDDV